MLLSLLPSAMFPIRTFQTLAANPAKAASYSPEEQAKLRAEASARIATYQAALDALTPAAPVTELAPTALLELFAPVLVKGDAYQQRRDMLVRLASREVDALPADAQRVLFGLMVRESQRYLGTYRSSAGEVERLVFESRELGTHYFAFVQDAGQNLKRSAKTLAAPATA